MAIERVKSGIPGLDKLTEGGFVKGSVNLVAGTTGTGKTIFCCQYLLDGLRKGENGVYLTLEQSKDEILRDVSVFGWDEEFREFINQNKLKMEFTFPTSIKKLGEFVLDMIEKINAKRFVLDSLSVATMGWEVSSDISKIRREVFELMVALKKRGVTSLLITEVPETDVKALSKFGFEEFVSDGIVKLYYIGIGGEDFMHLEIRKMRRTKHARGLYPMNFTKNGLTVEGEKVTIFK